MWRTTALLVEAIGTPSSADLVVDPGLPAALLELVGVAEQVGTLVRDVVAGQVGGFALEDRAHVRGVLAEERRPVDQAIAAVLDHPADGPPGALRGPRSRRRPSRCRPRRGLPGSRRGPLSPASRPGGGGRGWSASRRRRSPRPLGRWSSKARRVSPPTASTTITSILDRSGWASRARSVGSSIAQPLTEAITTERIGGGSWSRVVVDIGGSPFPMDLGGRGEAAAW